MLLHFLSPSHLDGKKEGREKRTVSPEFVFERFLFREGGKGEEWIQTS